MFRMQVQSDEKSIIYIDILGNISGFADMLFRDIAIGYYLYVMQACLKFCYDFFSAFAERSGYVACMFLDLFDQIVRSKELDISFFFQNSCNCPARRYQSTVKNIAVGNYNH